LTWLEGCSAYNPRRMNRLPAVRILLLILACSTFLSPWQRQLYVGDETKYGQILREMHSSGSLLVPELGGEPYSHKPPLHFWFVYALSLLFGLNSIWPFVIPSLLAYLATLAIVRALSREIFPEASASLSMLICGSFYLIWGLGQTARMDVQFQALVSLAVLLLHRFLRTGEQRYLLFMAVAVGSAVLVKGPMAFVIVAVLVLFEAMRRKGLPAGRWVLATMIAIALPLLWLIPALATRGRAYADELLIKQNIGRAVGAWVHREPPWFYITHFPLDFFPWAALIVVVLIAGLRDATMRANPDWRFCLHWVLAVVLPFTLLSSKLDIYMVPAAIPFGLILSRFVASDTSPRWRNRGAWANVFALAVLSVIAATVLIGLRVTSNIRGAELLLRPPVQGFFWMLLLIPLAGIVAVFVGKGDRLYRSVLVVAAAAVLPLAGGAALLIGVANEAASTQPLIAALEKQKVRGEQIALFRMPFLWSTTMPEELNHVRYIGPRGLTESGPTPPVVVGVQGNRAHWLNPKLDQEYMKVDEIEMKGKAFAIYRRR